MTVCRDATPIPKPFTIAVPGEILDDLGHRLANVRWPDEVSGGDWDYGVDLSYIKSLVAYWRDHYDWRKHEEALNRFRQFTVPLANIDVHFIHEQGVGPNSMPLLLTHGWPGSVLDFHKIIPLLTDPERFGGDPADAFTVVAPSMPGYGFSFHPGQPRFSLQEIADVFNDLMTRVLGYQRYGSQGGDYGAFISSRLGYAYPDNLAGIHISLLAIPREQAAIIDSSEEEKAFFAQLDHWLREEAGYTVIMGTKPQTLAYGLTDSPVGLAAWIVEKFRSWSDCGGDVDAYFTRDLLLTNIMIYWVTGSINASAWPYYMRRHGPWIVPEGELVTVPCGYAEFPREFLTPPRSLAERMYANIVRWTRMEHGGHFPALEAPDALAKEIRAFFRPLR